MHHERPSAPRAVWISDVHLGTRSCRAKDLLGFLSGIAPRTLYLVGDIVDFWKFRGSLYWPASHTAVLRRIWDLRREGTRVVFVPGNHDGVLRAYAKHGFGGIEIRRRVVHRLADGRRLLVFHGDELDARVRSSGWMAPIGDAAYDLLLGLDVVCSGMRRRFGLESWSLASWIKSRVSQAAHAIERFESAACRHARRRGYDGLVCGHIHVPRLRERDGVLYGNCGDWVESCTALVEDAEGHLSLLPWGRTDRTSTLASRSAGVEVPVSGSGVHGTIPPCANETRPAVAAI